MNRLFLLRHAQALPARDMKDFDRPLSPQGEKDALAQGAAMKEKKYQPSMVLCSPALRTRMTLEAVAQSLSPSVVEYPHKLYDGDIEDYLTILESISAYKDVMIVGHNPVIHALAASLAQEDGSTKLGYLMSGYVPCTLSVFETAAPDWRNLHLHENRLVDFLPPVSPY